MTKLKVSLPTKPQVSAQRVNQLEVQRDMATMDLTAIYQPLGNSKFLKSKGVTTSTQQILVIGNASNALGAVTGMIASASNRTINIVQGYAPHIINKLKLQCSNAASLNNNPVLVYKNADGQNKEVEIDLADYLNEYQYKTKILTVPVRFVYDSRFMYIKWDIGSSAVGDTGTMTLSVEKVLGKVSHI